MVSAIFTVFFTQISQHNLLLLMAMPRSSVKFFGQSIPLFYPSFLHFQSDDIAHFKG